MQEQRTDQITVDEFYARAKYPKGTRVQHPDDPNVRGSIVKKGGQIWVSRDKLPWVRWDGKIDAVQVPWEELIRA